MGSHDQYFLIKLSIVGAFPCMANHVKKRHFGSVLGRQIVDALKSGKAPCIHHSLSIAMR
jgi:hypothetical protein